MTRPRILRSLLAILLAAPAFAGGSNLPPFDFSDAFYRANGIDPARVVGRPTGTLPNSVIDATPNGPDFNDVRILQQAAAFDHSGHPIFFSVTGILLSTAVFTNDAAGQEAFQIAEQYKVYEFPRSTNAQFAVFPKRQDLVADLRNGYFSNDPLGIWQVNIVRFTTAATTTQAGQIALAELASRNGVDLDGTPMIRTIGEIEDLQDDGFVTIEVPPIDGPALRWFLCPVVEDPRDGAIAPDAHLDIVGQPDGTPLAAERDAFELFNCLRATGDECNGASPTIAAYCFGTATACPCGNAGSAQAGCRNSTGSSGRLVAEGLARVGNDSIDLLATGLTGSTVLFFQGTEVVGGGLGATFGDGLRCAGGSVVRIGVAPVSSGSARYPNAGDASVSARGNVVGGTTRMYQAWYRNAASFCTDSTFNLTNAVRIGWIG